MYKQLDDLARGVLSGAMVVAWQERFESGGAPSPNWESAVQRDLRRRSVAARDLRVDGDAPTECRQCDDLRWGSVAARDLRADGDAPTEFRHCDDLRLSSVAERDLRAGGDAPTEFRHCDDLRWSSVAERDLRADQDELRHCDDMRWGSVAERADGDAPTVPRQCDSQPRCMRRLPRLRQPRRRSFHRGSVPGFPAQPRLKVASRDRGRASTTPARVGHGI